ncbi:MAG: ATP-binding protein, partial [Thermodesulfobacteriota bacterium]
MTIRAKAILSVTFTIGLLTAVFLALGIQQQNAHLRQLLEDKKSSAHFLADTLQEQIFTTYRTRIVSLATTKQDVIEAFARRDRQALQQATLPFYRTIQKENPYFHIMHFHLPDGTSYLRMHFPDIHGDDLAEIRPMVHAVNEDHKQRSGYEVGKNGLSFRVVQPVFSHQHYIGALEFGIDHEQLLHLLRQRISPEIAVAVKTDMWRKAIFIKKETISQGGYTILPGSGDLFRHIPSSFLLDQQRESRIRIGDKDYQLFADITLPDYQGNPVARITVALDISAELAGSRNLLAKGIFSAVVLLLCAGLILYFSFGQLLRQIFGLNDSLKTSNAELSSANSSIENILATMSDGLLVTGMDGTISRVNRALCLLLGGADEMELIGSPLSALFANQAKFAALFRPDSASAWHITKQECQLVTRTATIVPVLFSASLLREQGEGVVCIVTDITERKLAETALREAHDQLEQRVIERTRELAETNAALIREMGERKRMEAELRQAQKMRAIGTLAGGIAHDFNNILTAIIGYTELAQKQSLDSTSRSCLQEVLTAGMRARDLVRQILTFSRQTEQERIPIEARHIVKEALKLLRASLPTTIEISQKLHADRGVVLADPSQIHQIVMNLCTNAYHAMEEKGGTLTVELTRTSGDAVSPPLPPGNYLLLMVRDTGCGMDSATMERIFEPYFTTKEPGKGTGLGLAVTHGIVESHGGHIRVTSVTGAGSTFNVYLPLHNDLPAQPISQEQRGDIKGGTERLLVVDDEKDIVQLFNRFLGGAGYRVTGLTDSQAAQTWFTAHSHEVDLVITDMTMPHQTGKDLAHAMLARRPDLPIILATGFNESINEQSAHAIGIRALLAKPFQEM